MQCTLKMHPVFSGDFTNEINYTETLRMELYIY